MEVQAVFHIYNINNNKHEHEKKNNRGERFTKIPFPTFYMGEASPHPPTPHTLDSSFGLHISHLPRMLPALRPLALRPLPFWPVALWPLGTLALWLSGPLVSGPLAPSSLSRCLHHLWQKKGRKAWLIYILGLHPLFSLGHHLPHPKTVDQKRL